MMMFSNAMRSALYDVVVPRNLKFNRLTSINFFIAGILSSSLIMPESFLELVRLVDERLQDFVELLHVFGSVSFRGVADQCCMC